MISKNQSKQSQHLNQQIGNMSSQLGQLRANQNQCSSNFHGIEKTVSEYKNWSENRKTLIRGRITTVEKKTQIFNALFSHPDNPVRNSAMQVRKSMFQDCILPD